MGGIGFALFETPLGPCGVAWGARGVVGVQLPEGSAARTRAQLRRRFPGSADADPPSEVESAIAAIGALLRGEPADLSSIALDMDGVPEFRRRVYEAARGVAPGQTIAYGELAARLGSPGAARAVGAALACNPFPIVVPCHRVLAANGKLGGFTASGGAATKVRMLSLEGARADAAPLGYAPDAAVAHLRAVDATLARLIDSVGPLALAQTTTASLFGALAEAIVHQQLSGRAAQTIHARVCALFPRGQHGPSAEQILRCSDAKLRGAGLSRAKLAALRDLARHAKDGEIPTLAEARELDDEALVERLTRVRGIGRWTVEMLLIFRLGRPDVLPVDDFGVRKGYALAYRKRALPAPKELSKLGERWAPYRSAAAWYLWRAADRAAK